MERGCFAEQSPRLKKIKAFGVAVVTSVGLLIVDSSAAEAPTTLECEITQDDVLQTSALYEPLQIEEVKPYWPVEEIETALVRHNLTGIDSHDRHEAMANAIDSGFAFTEQLMVFNEFTKQRGIEVSYEGPENSGDRLRQSANYTTAEGLHFRDRLYYLLFETESLPREFFEASKVKKLNFKSGETNWSGLYAFDTNTMHMKSDVSEMYPVFMHELAHAFQANLADLCRNSKEAFMSLNPSWFTYAGDIKNEDGNDTTNSLSSPDMKALLKKEALEAGVVVSEYAAINYLEDYACTFEKYIGDRGIKIHELREASEIQKHKLMVILSSFHQLQPHLANYLLELTAIGVKNGLASARGSYR